MESQVVATMSGLNEPTAMQTELQEVGLRFRMAEHELESYRDQLESGFQAARRHIHEETAEMEQRIEGARRQATVQIQMELQAEKNERDSATRLLDESRRAARRVEAGEQRLATAATRTRAELTGEMAQLRVEAD